MGKTLLAIVNLPHRSMVGIDSCGMLMSAIHEENDEERLNLVMLNDVIPAGQNWSRLINGSENDMVFLTDTSSCNV